MKRLIRIAGALALVLAGMGANAQNTHQVRVAVPFSFEAAGKTLPAGDYSLSFDPSNSVVTLQGKSKVVVSLTVMSETSNGRENFLRFDTYGQRHVLRDVSFSGDVRRVSTPGAVPALIASEQNQPAMRAGSQSASAGSEGQN